MQSCRVVWFVAALCMSAGCPSPSGDGQTQSLPARITPATVSSTGAWSLFDGSTTSGFVPATETVTATLDKATQIFAVKIHGASPYRLRINGKGGAGIGFPSIDLSQLKAGWNGYREHFHIVDNRTARR